MRSEKGSRRNRERDAHVGRTFHDDWTLSASELYRAMGLHRSRGPRKLRVHNPTTVDGPKPVFLEADDADITKMIFHAVGTTFDYTLQQLEGRERSDRISQARNMCGYLLRKYTDYTIQEIGLLLGGREHSSAIRGINSFINRHMSDGWTRHSGLVRQALKAFEEEIGNGETTGRIDSDLGNLDSGGCDDKPVAKRDRS